MTSQYLSVEDHELKIPLKSSLILHVAIFLIFSVKAAFFTDEPIVINNAVRVDLVALPDKMKTDEPEAVKAEPEKVKIEKPVAKPQEPKFDLEKIRREQKEAVDKLRNQKKKKVEPTEEPETKAPPAPPPSLYKGNVLSPGSEVVGVAKLEYDKYFDLARAKIKLHFVLPQWLKDTGLRTHVHVKIDERGYVIDRTLVKSSNNEIYDKLVLKAVTDASPLPPPPEKLKDILKFDGIILAYPD